MKLLVTGDLRTIAESAWISTLSEMQSKKRSDEEVTKVVTFLVKEHHTSPLESVTLTFSTHFPPTEGDEYTEEQQMKRFFEESGKSRAFMRLSRGEDKEMHLTVDLLNFIKRVKFEPPSAISSSFYKIFAKTNKSIADLIDANLKQLQDSSPSYDIQDDLGSSLGMEVELVKYHKTPVAKDCRATWRIKCPLSIATQILRHRSNSFNQVSGRYRTLKVEFVNRAEDVNLILEKASVGDSWSKIEEEMQQIARNYNKIMSDLKASKEASAISNDEYKRAREFVRFCLPEGRMTEIYVTSYVDDFEGLYLKLRNSVHAQNEHIWVAQQMKKKLNEVK